MFLPTSTAGGAPAASRSDLTQPLQPILSPICEAAASAGQTFTLAEYRNLAGGARA